ncbi:ANTAR domain-containing response regulator [soil metagenome]
MATATPLRVLLVGLDSPHIEILHAELERIGCTVVGVLDAAFDIVRQVESLQPDAIIIDSDSPQRDTLEHIAAMSLAAPRPIVMFSDDADPALMKRVFQAGVSSYVVEGLSTVRLMPLLQLAIARFEADLALRNELAATREQLADRKRIERAKGILMADRQIDEEAAYRQLRKLAMDRKLRLIDVADRIIDAKDLIG